MKRLAVAVLILSALALATEREKALYKIFRASTTTVIVSCGSGQIPEVSPPHGRVQEGIVVITCVQ